MGMKAPFVLATLFVVPLVFSRGVVNVLAQTIELNGDKETCDPHGAIECYHSIVNKIITNSFKNNDTELKTHEINFKDDHNHSCVQKVTASYSGDPNSTSEGDVVIECDNYPQSDSPHQHSHAHVVLRLPENITDLSLEGDMIFEVLKFRVDGEDKSGKDGYQASTADGGNSVNSDVLSTQSGGYAQDNGNYADISAAYLNSNSVSASGENASNLSINEADQKLSSTSTIEPSIKYEYQTTTLPQYYTDENYSNTLGALSSSDINYSVSGEGSGSRNVTTGDSSVYTKVQNGDGYQEKSYESDSSGRSGLSYSYIDDQIIPYSNFTATQLGNATKGLTGNTVLSTLDGKTGSLPATPQNSYYEYVSDGNATGQAPVVESSIIPQKPYVTGDNSTVQVPVIEELIIPKKTYITGDVNYTAPNSASTPQLIDGNAQEKSLGSISSSFINGRLGSSVSTAKIPDAGSSLRRVLGRDLESQDALLIGNDISGSSAVVVSSSSSHQPSVFTTVIIGSTTAAVEPSTLSGASITYTTYSTSHIVNPVSYTTEYSEPSVTSYATTYSELPATSTAYTGESTFYTTVYPETPALTYVSTYSITPSVSILTETPTSYAFTLTSTVSSASVETPTISAASISRTSGIKEEAVDTERSGAVEDTEKSVALRQDFPELSSGFRTFNVVKTVPVTSDISAESVPVIRNTEKVVYVTPDTESAVDRGTSVVRGLSYVIPEVLSTGGSRSGVTTRLTNARIVPVQEQQSILRPTASVAGRKVIIESESAPVSAADTGTIINQSPVTQKLLLVNKVQPEIESVVSTTRVLQPQYRITESPVLIQQSLTQTIVRTTEPSVVKPIRELEIVNEPIVQKLTSTIVVREPPTTVREIHRFVSTTVQTSTSYSTSYITVTPPPEPPTVIKVVSSVTPSVEIITSTPTTSVRIISGEPTTRIYKSSPVTQVMVTSHPAQIKVITTPPVTYTRVEVVSAPPTTVVTSSPPITRTYITRYPPRTEVVTMSPATHVSVVSPLNTTKVQSGGSRTEVNLILKGKSRVSSDALKSLAVEAKRQVPEVNQLAVTGGGSEVTIKMPSGSSGAFVSSQQQQGSNIFVENPPPSAPAYPQHNDTFTVTTLPSETGVSQDGENVKSNTTHNIATDNKIISGSTTLELPNSVIAQNETRSGPLVIQPNVKYQNEYSATPSAVESSKSDTPFNKGSNIKTDRYIKSPHLILPTQRANETSFKPLVKNLGIIVPQMHRYGVHDRPHRPYDTKDTMVNSGNTVTILPSNSTTPALNVPTDNETEIIQPLITTPDGDPITHLPLVPSIAVGTIETPGMLDVYSNPNYLVF